MQSQTDIVGFAPKFLPIFSNAQYCIMIIIIVLVKVVQLGIMVRETIIYHNALSTSERLIIYHNTLGMSEPLTRYGYECVYFKAALK